MIGFSEEGGGGGGSSGMHAVVLKPGSASNLPAELYGSRLAAALGLPVPAARIPSMDEHIVINRSLSPARLYEKIEDKNVLMYR